jgi:hypothetical protein
MKCYKNSVLGLFLVLVLVAGLSPWPILAEGDYDQSNTIRIHVRAIAGPIGTVESFGMMSIGGRAAQGRRALWGSELLQAPSLMNVDLQLNSVGKATLMAGGIARVSTALTDPDDMGSNRVLVASLIKGDMNIRLQKEAGAYIETCGYRLTAAQGSSFHVGVREDRPEIEVTAGLVQVDAQATQRKYLIRPVGLGASISVRARSTRQIQIQVTDENDKPVPDMPILFALGAAGNGTLGSGTTAGTAFTTTTNARGLATVQYTAGDTPGTNSITATIEGTNYSWTAEITILKAVGFWTTQNKVLVAAGAAAAGVATGVAVSNSGDSERRRVPITPNGTGIRP